MSMGVIVVVMIVVAMLIMLMVVAVVIMMMVMVMRGMIVRRVIVAGMRRRSLGHVGVSGIGAAFRLKRRSVQSERRKIIRIKIDVVMIGNVARSRIEGAPVGGHLRPVLPVRRDPHPLTQQRMPPKLAHEFDCGMETTSACRESIRTRMLTRNRADL
jgi:hypothetical protein